MNITHIVGVLLAVAVVATGAAVAAPGNAPADTPAEQADEHGADADAENRTDGEANDAANASADASADATAERGPPADVDQRGPPVDLPDQVPDFVGEIHDLIRQHLQGALDGILGHEVSDVTPDDDDAQAVADNGTADGTSSIEH